MGEQIESWKMVMRRSYRPWRTLWLTVRWHEIVATREGTEAEILANAADLKATSPRWQIELRRDE
jgi:hypothetical protein